MYIFVENHNNSNCITPNCVITLALRNITATPLAS